jgi:hypothetical protein
MYCIVNSAHYGEFDEDQKKITPSKVEMLHSFLGSRRLSNLHLLVSRQYIDGSLKKDTDFYSKNLARLLMAHLSRLMWYS